MSLLKLTKAQLVDLCVVRNGEVEALRLRVAELEGDVQALKGAAVRARAGGPVRSAYVPAPPNAEVLARRAAMAAAREAAMRGGVAVKAVW